MSLIANNHFTTPIYFEEKKEWVQKLNSVSDKYSNNRFMGTRVFKIRRWSS
jgi:hypothetical protein